MHLALEAATNLAAFMKTDVNAAAKMMSQAIESGGESLGRLKKILGEAYTEGMTTTEMLEALNTKLGPAAQNELKTFNGQMANLNNQFSNIHEQGGQMIVETMTTLLGVFNALPEPVRSAGIAIVAIGKDTIPLLGSLAQLGTLLSQPWAITGIMTAAKAVIGILTGPVGIAIAIGTLLALVILNWDKIVAYTQKLYEGIKLWLLDKFSAVVAAVKAPIDAVTGFFQNMYHAVVGGSIVPDMINGISTHFGRLDSVMVEPARAASSAVQAEFGKMMEYQNKVNALYSEYAGTRGTPTIGLQQNAAALAAQVFGTGGGGGGGATTVNNTFNISGGGDMEALARKVADMVLRTVRAGTQLSTA